MCNPHSVPPDVTGRKQLCVAANQDREAFHYFLRLMPHYYLFDNSRWLINCYTPLATQIHGGVGMSKNEYKHFAFLDGVRFLCALWVVFYHLGAPPIFRLASQFSEGKTAEIFTLLQRGFGVTFNGTAAVVAFFLISGFCIHYPYAAGKTLRIPAFYLARASRIGIPILAVSLVAAALPGGLHALGSVIWSLYAELIYYALYPLLLNSFKKFGIDKVIATSFIAAILLSMVPENKGGYLWSYGISLTWLLCLPMWLLGCKIAELLSSPNPLPIAQGALPLLFARLGVVAMGAIAGVLAFMHWVTLKHSMLFFSLPCAVWLFMEFRQSETNNAYRFFSKMGSACFSIYLSHTLAPIAIGLVLGVNKSQLSWPVVMASVTVGSLACYWLLEEPSHRLSKRLSRIGRRDEEIVPADTAGPVTSA